MSQTQRLSVPAPGAIRRFDFPPVQIDHFNNGLKLLSVQTHRLPIVTVGLVLDAGEATLDEDKAGLAVLTGDSLEGGTTARSRDDLAEAMESIGAHLSVRTGWDSTIISLSCLPERLEEALNILAEVALSPNFPADEVDRIRKQHLAGIQQRNMDPSAMATEAFHRLIYAEGVPYGRPLGGSVESAAPFNQDAAIGFVKTQYNPGNAGLVVVGDVDLDDTNSLAKSCLGDWQGRPITKKPFDPEPRFRERKVVIIDRPGAVQSEIRIGHVGQPRSTSDYFPLVILNTILGGSFTSRLNLNLRERHGFTYGVRSGFAFRRDAGPWTISTSVGTHVTADAVREALKELDVLISAGPTDEELAASRDYISGVFPLRFETTNQIASQISEIIIYNLPNDYHTTYRDQIRSVNYEQVMDAVQRCIRPDEITVLVVGDAKTIRNPIENLGSVPVEVRDSI